MKSKVITKSLFSMHEKTMLLLFKSLQYFPLRNDLHLSNERHNLTDLKDLCTLKSRIDVECFVFRVSALIRSCYKMIARNLLCSVICDGRSESERSNIFLIDRNMVGTNFERNKIAKVIDLNIFIYFTD